MIPAIKTREQILAAGIRAVNDLISSSHGVAGLHLNYDVAPWDELRSGGEYEEWLSDFDEALKLVQE